MADSALIETICSKLAEGMSMRRICAERGMPNRRTLERWMADDADLAASIARARDIGYDERADQAVEAAKSAGDAALGRLALDAERWYLSKLYSKKYGDKLTHAGDGDAPLSVTINKP